MGEKLLPDELGGRLVLDPLLANGTVYPEGTLPVNVSGGLKSKGHPVGPTGVSQHVMAAMQLTDAAGEMQLENAGRAAVHNMGGLAIANYVTVIERRIRSVSLPSHPFDTWLTRQACDSRLSEPGRDGQIEAHRNRKDRFA